MYTSAAVAGYFGLFTVLAAIIAALAYRLHRQRLEYRTLFESVPCAITVIDKNYRVVSYNREFAENLAHSLNGYCYSAFKGKHEKCSECPVEKTFKEGATCTSEEMRINRDGSKKYWLVKTAPIRDVKGEITSAMEMCLDITPLKSLQEELSRSEKKYYAIFNNIPNAVFVLNPVERYQILDCNRNVTSVYGYAQEEIISRSFLGLFLKEEREHYVFQLRQARDIAQARQIRKDGGIIYVSINISPAEYLEERVLLVTVSDITQRLEREQQLAQTSKLATLGEMATGVAHELNQPLTVIKMASRFIAKKIEQKHFIPAETLTRMVEKIDTNVDRANDIITRMRDFARKSSLELEAVDLNAVLKNAFEIFSQQLKLRMIEVVLRLKADLPPILADARRLEQVVINLLVNARDAIEERYGQRDGDGCERMIFITSRVRSGKVIAEVSDTGMGVSESIRDKIFEPFFTTKEVGKGTGLGLSISYGIVKEFRGDIGVTDNAHGGACFQLTFPIHIPRDDRSDG